VQVLFGVLHLFHVWLPQQLVVVLELVVMVLAIVVKQLQLVLRTALEGEVEKFVVMELVLAVKLLQLVLLIVVLLGFVVMELVLAVKLLHLVLLIVVVAVAHLVPLQIIGIVILKVNV